MLNNEILIKRLAHIKQLYLIGVEQSHQPESIAVFSLLAFHDSIEMFLKLLSEHKGLNSSKYNFMDYWTNVPELTLKESMRGLNARRVNLKHKGLIPAKSEIEISRVNTIDFFEQNTENQFGIKFEDISLIELVSNERVKEYLKKGEEFKDSDESVWSVVNCAYAFNELLHSYLENKVHRVGDPVSFWSGADIDSPELIYKKEQHLATFYSGYSDTSKKLYDDFKELEKYHTTLNNGLSDLNEFAKITALGINYKEFTKFKILTPEIMRTNENELLSLGMDGRYISKNNYDFCLNFVINSAQKLQEFDFDMDSLLP